MSSSYVLVQLAINLVLSATDRPHPIYTLTERDVHAGRGGSQLAAGLEGGRGQEGRREGAGTLEQSGMAWHRPEGKEPKEERKAQLHN